MGGSEQSKVLPRGCTEATCQTVYDSGNVWANVGTASANYGYGQGDDSTTVASGLAAQLNGNVVHAAASGSTVSLTAAASGSNTNYAISVGSDTTEGDFGHPSFTATASGATLTGGANGYYSGGNTVYSLGGITYAGDNDMLAATDSVNGAYSFSYNDLNQLAQACTPSCSGTVDAYTYDRYGNRWTGPGSSLTFNNSYNRMDGASYDANGNLTSSNGQTLQYDAENRLVGVNGGATASYVYDAEGRRVHESVGGVVKEYIYAQDGQELSVVDASQNLLQGETYFGGRTLATVGSVGTSYAHTDWLGTVRARTGPAGALAGAYTSGPFGENLSAIGGASSLHLTGKYRDGETGFDYSGARYYSSGLGRFLTPDPLGGDIYNPQSLNRYAYAWNNPATLTDPTGMYVCADAKENTGGCNSAADRSLAQSLANDLKSKDADVVRAAEAYGKANVDNGVRVTFGDPGKGNAGTTVSQVGYDPSSSNLVRADSDITLNSGLSGAAMDAAVAHEGSHAADAQEEVAKIAPDGSNLAQALSVTQRQSEQRAFTVTGTVLASEGVAGSFCPGDCRLGAGVSPAVADRSVQQILSRPPYSLAPGASGPLIITPVTAVPH